MSYSDGLKVNVNKLNADEALLVLLEITHPFLSTPLRLVSDNKNLVSNGFDFIAMNFKIHRQSDVQGELPKVSLTIPNVGRSLVRWIDSSEGGKNANINVMLARRSTPDTIEESLNFGVDRVNITTDLITFSLVVQNNLIKRSVRFVYDIKRAPGLF